MNTDRYITMLLKICLHGHGQKTKTAWKKVHWNDLTAFQKQWRSFWSIREMIWRIKEIK